jgi:hypothetical protein
MTKKKHPEERVTTQPGARPEAAVTLRPGGEALAKTLSASQGPPGEAHEFSVVVAHSRTDRVFPPFIVRAKDEAAARKLARRNYLVILSVERFVEVDGAEKPRTLPYGPPISDKDFERDYGNRAPDSPKPAIAASSVLGIVGCVFCGPLGALAGWLIGRSIDEPET